MYKIKLWLYTYHTEITWFLNGFLVCSGLDAFSNEEYLNGLMCFTIAFFNHKINTK
jgi:hypothetical protein